MPLECIESLRLYRHSGRKHTLTLERFCTAIIVVSFLCAEAWHPTLLRPKKNSTSSLIVATQNEVPYGTETRFGADLLDDLPRIDALPLGNVDAVISAAHRINPGGKLKFSVSRNSNVQIVGWFADAQSRSPAAALFAIIDGRRFGDADITYGAVRPDVGRFYQTPALDPTGFALRLPGGFLARGRHNVEFGVVSSDRRGFFLAPEALVLDESR